MQPFKKVKKNLNKQKLTKTLIEKRFLKLLLIIKKINLKNNKNNSYFFDLCYKSSPGKGI